jgi:phenylacetate-coenzyme A ligase PaaK-like adenylate-forming protein
MTHERCPSCGRGGESLVVAVGSAHVTRTKELLKVKGTLINPAIIHDVVMSERGILEYQVVVDREDPEDELSSDVLRLLVAVEDGDAGRAVDLEELGRRVHSATEIRPVIEPVEDAGQIYDPSSQFKAQRFVDRRVIS